MILNLLFTWIVTSAQTAPTDASHPGSKVYNYEATHQQTTCLQRKVNIVAPQTQTTAGEKFPVVVFGHGQALDLDHYKMTFEHLAKKGVIVLFPQFDTGFFDQDWSRMGSDFVKQTECALQQLPDADLNAVVFAGHSKGAYVASVAAGSVELNSVSYKLRANVLFAPAGSSNSHLKQYPPKTATTVVYSDSDTIVSKSISENIYRQATSEIKQLITVKSYVNPPLKADHFWVLTKSSFAGGKNGDNALHHHGAWKWLVSAAWDVRDGAKSNSPFLYGEWTTDKGVSGLVDDLQKNW